MTDQINIVKRDTIPPLQLAAVDSTGDTLGELRDFRWHDQLRDFMPGPSRFSVSWLALGPGEVLHSRLLPTDSLVIFYAGAGEMLGDLPRSVVKEDVVVVPSGCSHGFVSGRDGLYALTIQFGDAPYGLLSDDAAASVDHGRESLDALLDYNAERLVEFEQRPLFELLADETLLDSNRRAAFLSGLAPWLEGTRAVLTAWQATCPDPVYQSACLTLQEVWPSEKASKNEAKLDAADASRRDPIVGAVADWFAHQMYVLDNIEKAAIVHLVLASASVVYRRHAARVLNGHGLWTDLGFEQAETRAELFLNQSPRTYQRLQQIVAEAWDMLGAMTDRVVELTREG